LNPFPAAPCIDSYFNLACRRFWDILCSPFQDALQTLNRERLMMTRHSFADGNTSSILDNLNTAVFRSNLDGMASLIDVNPAFVSMFGYRHKRDLESLSILSFYVVPEDRKRMQDILVKEGHVRNLEIMFKRKDGSVFPGRVTSVLVKDEAGNGLFIDGVVEDISELKFKEKQLLEEQRVFFTGPVVMIQWPVSEDAPLLDISANVKELLGYEVSDFLDGKILYPDLVHSEDKPGLQAHIRSVLEEGSDTMLVHPYRLRRKQGDYIWVQDYAYIQRDEQGEVKGILGYIYDVTAQQDSQRESLEKEHRLRDLIDNAPTGIIRIDDQGNILEVNQRMVEMLGSPSKEATMSFNMFNFEPLIQAGITKRFKQSIENHEIVSYTSKYVSAWGKKVYFKLIITPIQDAEGRVTGAQANMEDITRAHRAKSAERKIRKAQLEERKIFMAGPIMVVKWPLLPHDPFLYVSDNTERVLGYTPEEMMSPGMVPANLIHPEDLERVRLTGRQAVESGLNDFEVSPYRMRKKDGSYIWVSDFSSINRDETGNPVDLSGIIWDVSSLIEAEHEMQLLLREVHHRVKNNMQVIISLLNLQADYVRDKKLVQVFGETEQRIRSMALIHDKLFRSERISAVDFGSYIRSLILEIQHSRKVKREHVTFYPEVRDVNLDISKAIPCGLIINELVSNALKHAFPNNREGKIWVSGEMLEASTVMIEVRDNGVGLSRDVLLEKTQTLGLRIVRILVEQLEGEIKVIRRGGTRFRLTFPLLDGEDT